MIGRVKSKVLFTSLSAIKLLPPVFKFWRVANPLFRNRLNLGLESLQRTKCELLGSQHIFLKFSPISEFSLRSMMKIFANGLIFLFMD